MALTVFEFFVSVSIGAMVSIFGVIMWRMFQNWRWPIKVPIAIQRGKSIVWDLTERARHITRRDGSEALKLKKRGKDTLKPPKYDSVSVDKKGKAVYPIFNTIAGQYFPIKLTKGVSLDAIEDKSSKNWAIAEVTRLNDVYRPKEGWLAKYGMFIMNATFAAMVIFFVIYFSGKMELSANALASGATRMAEALEKLSAAQGNMPQP